MDLFKTKQALAIPTYNPDDPSKDQHTKCLKMRNNILNNPKIVFLFAHINELQKEANLHNQSETKSPKDSFLLPNELVQCVTHCPSHANAVSITGDDVKNEPNAIHAMVGICEDNLENVILRNFQNQNNSPNQFQKIVKRNLSQDKLITDVTHELIHLYDKMRIKFDPTDCFQALCSEVRASMLSGECQPTTMAEIDYFSIGNFNQSKEESRRYHFQKIENNGENSGENDEQIESSAHKLNTLQFGNSNNNNNNNNQNDNHQNDNKVTNTNIGQFQQCVRVHAMKSTVDYQGCGNFFDCFGQNENSQTNNLQNNAETAREDQNRRKNIDWVIHTCMLDTSPFPFIP